MIQLGTAYRAFRSTELAMYEAAQLLTEEPLVRLAETQAIVDGFMEIDVLHLGVMMAILWQLDVPDEFREMIRPGKPN
jgi:hypothetical protein